jgi:carbohydrate-binding DOMON domain-containing protein
MLSRKFILTALIILLYNSISFAKEEQTTSTQLTGATFVPNAVLSIQDPLYSQLNTGNFASYDPAVYVRMGLKDESGNIAAMSQVYTCLVTLTVTPYNYSYNVKD